MSSILTVGIILFVGFLFGEIATKIKLPRITGYLLAGICLNPQVLPIISEDFTRHTKLVTNISLSFITFSVGGTLLFPRVKKLGKTILLITVLEAECALLAVTFGLFLVISLLRIAPSHAVGMTLPVCILLGCLACPTDPSATLAVVHEYKARGTVVSTIMGVAAFDDALGIVNYSLGVALATLLIQDQGFSLRFSLLEPAAGIAGGMLIGAIFGLVFNRLTLLMEKETEGSLIVVIFGMLCLCFGIASSLRCDELLATMTMGCVVVNYNPKHEQVFMILERYTEELIFVLFFTLSGMHLNFSAISGAYVLIFFFVLFRALGKLTGTMLGALISNAPEEVRRYAALGLIPQGGIVIGLALMIKNNPALAAFSDALIGIVIGATVIHELIGPVASKTALMKAGETHLHNDEEQIS